MGSKRIPISMFASEVCSRRGHVVVVNVFLPNFNLKDVLGSIERVYWVADLGLPSCEYVSPFGCHSRRGHPSQSPSLAHDTGPLGPGEGRTAALWHFLPLH
ncbi:hypothetical protein FIBSPDRAFT_854908 [Athelia psychrophila]|uniref:Origin recognition complex subunit 2 n=1 Tax=Athelia psychrophila TaxID=1759441 RepID=A0A166PNJ1_9AGAM|nr:hypothetical protein FIBSPDRAFT_854908 [Fibularhizoctonia sp. CBS 109695]